MRRFCQVALVLMVGFWATALFEAALFANLVRADTRTSFFASELRTNEDPRVRTQAALALGASGDDAAVKPLCDGLGDSNVAVRAASAAALGKLAKSGGTPCLKTAIKKEADRSVKSQIEKSIELIAGGGSSAGGAAPPPPGKDAKFYVAIQVTNKTTRPSAQVESLVRGAMQKKLLATSGYAVAPAGETPQKGGEVVRSKRLTGYFLIATVQPPVYENGNLVQVVRVSMWTYPDKSLKGEFSPKLTQTNTQPGDTKSEEVLMKMCVENAITTFQKVAASM